MRLDAMDAGNPRKLDATLAEIPSRGARGIIVTIDPFFDTNRVRLVQFAASKRLPATYFSEEYVTAVGLMSYGSSLADTYRRAVG